MKFTLLKNSYLSNGIAIPGCLEHLREFSYNVFALSL